MEEEHVIKDEDKDLIGIFQINANLQFENRIYCLKIPRRNRKDECNNS